jgi:O-antigen/teichoic acid export membrane protein
VAEAAAGDTLTADTSAALVSLALLALLQNLDVIVVGREAPDHTGAYGAISVACKALAYGAIALSAYLLPESAAAARRGTHALRQLAVTVGFVAIPASALLVLGLAAPEPLLELVFGADLTDGASALATLAGAMTCFAVTVLCTHYLLGAGRRAVVALLAVAAVAAGALLPLADGEFVATARVELGLHATLAAAALVLVARASPREAPARRRGRGEGASA